MNIMPVLGRSRSLRLKGLHRDVPEEYGTPQEASLSTTTAPRIDLSKLRSATSPAGGKRSNTRMRTKSETRPQTSGGQRDHRSKHTPTVVVAESPLTHRANFSPMVYCPARVREGQAIGVALGSPTQVDMWRRRAEPSTPSVSSSPTTSSASFSEQGNEKPRDNKVDRFKAIFRRKVAASPTVPFYKVQVQRLATPLDFHTYPDQPRHVLVPKQSYPRVPSEEGRKSAPSPLREATEIPKGKVSRAPKMPSKSKAPPTPSKEQQSPVPPPKDGPPTSSLPKVTVQAPGSKPFASESKPIGLMLDIEIPRSEMERYSIMFSDVLRPHEPESLLSRRLNTKGGSLLKPLGDFTVNTASANKSTKFARRATSPTHKSPSFTVSLFPPRDAHTTRSRTPSPTNSPYLRRPLQRSHTEPCKPTLEDLVAEERAKTTSQSPKPSHGLPTFNLVESPLSRQISGSEEDLRSQHKGVAKETGHELSKRKDSGFSPQTASSGVVPVVPAVKINATEAISSPLSSLKRRPTVERYEALVDSPQHPRDPSKIGKELPRTPHPTDTGNRSDGTVQVAIARKASVTKPRIVEPSRSIKSIRPRPSANERVVEGQKALTPTVVEPANRRSHRVQLVDA